MLIARGSHGLETTAIRGWRVIIQFPAPITGKRKSFAPVAFHPSQMRVPHRQYTDADAGRKQNSDSASSVSASTTDAPPPYSNPPASCPTDQLARQDRFCRYLPGLTDPAFPAARKVLFLSLQVMLCIDCLMISLLINHHAIDPQCFELRIVFLRQGLDFICKEEN